MKHLFMSSLALLPLSVSNISDQEACMCFLSCKIEVPPFPLTHQEEKKKGGGGGKWL